MLGKKEKKILKKNGFFGSCKLKPWKTMSDNPKEKDPTPWYVKVPTSTSRVGRDVGGVGNRRKVAESEGCKTPGGYNTVAGKND